MDIPISRGFLIPPTHFHGEEPAAMTIAAAAPVGQWQTMKSSTPGMVDDGDKTRQSEKPWKRKW